MRELLDQDIKNVIGFENYGYTIIQARLKNDDFSNSTNYGIALGRSQSGYFVTWQFHLVNEKPDCYWGRYFGDEEKAIENYNTRD